jgi:ribosomal-protein-alanine N-acetyltransferase
VRILTERLILRPFSPNDLANVHEYASDAEVCKYMVYGPNTPEETKKFLEMAIQESGKVPCVNLHLAIVLPASNELIGACGLDSVSLKNLDGDLGYCLKKNKWNAGYATEAARALIEYGFREMNLHRIHATCRPANLASANVLIKLGMQKEGHLREHRLIRGSWEDSFLFSVLRQEWKPNESIIKIEE